MVLLSWSKRRETCKDHMDSASAVCSWVQRCMVIRYAHVHVVYIVSAHTCVLWFVDIKRERERERERERPVH